VTARWVVETVGSERAVEVHWQPISLLLKNEPTEDSKWYAANRFTHNLLRVMESVRTAHGNEGVGAAYWEFATRIHHDGDMSFDPTAALSAAGLDPAHAAAFDDEQWDSEIKTRMEVGLELAGTDIGTPIIGFDDLTGRRVGIFGPVITRVLPVEQALQLWDGMVAVATVPGFWELKRTRTESPDIGARPTGPPPAGR
jgi:hypothetical protein